ADTAPAGSSGRAFARDHPRPLVNVVRAPDSGGALVRPYRNARALPGAGGAGGQLDPGCVRYARLPVRRSRVSPGRLARAAGASAWNDDAHLAGYYGRICLLLDRGTEADPRRRAVVGARDARDDHA